MVTIDSYCPGGSSPATEYIERVDTGNMRNAYKQD
jgi:hypothetical protein